MVSIDDGILTGKIFPNSPQLTEEIVASCSAEMFALKYERKLAEILDSLLLRLAETICISTSLIGDVLVKFLGYWSTGLIG